MKETWRPVVGYESYYKVSSYGRIYSTRLRRVLRGGCRPNGYMYFGAFADGGRKNVQIHRAVAEAFIPNPRNLPFVNHKDENPQNNRVDNLEWCTCLYNANYGTAKLRTAVQLAKPITVYDQDGNYIDSYLSVADVAKQFGVSTGNVVDCCKNRIAITHGFIFAYDFLSPEELKSRIEKHGRNVVGRWVGKMVNQYTQQGELIATYPSIRMASKATGFSVTSLRRCCNKGGSVSHGYRWEYAQS